MPRLFSSGKHRTATEIVAREIKFVSPATDREEILKWRRFDANGLLESWGLSSKIVELPETFGDVLCTGYLSLSNTLLESLPLRFSNLSVGGGLSLDYNKLRSLPPNFGQIRVGGYLNLRGNLGLTGIPAEFPNVKGTVYRP